MKEIQNITVVGTGYVGLVTGGYFANHGFNVTCLDISPQRIEALNKGEMPFFEPGLGEYISKVVQSGNLKFTTEYKLAMQAAEIVFICVGTPPKNGDADMSFVESALVSTLENIDHDVVIVGKSTMPFGIKPWVIELIKKHAKEGIDVKWVVNPEFLSEGTALEDMENPTRVVVGGDNESAVEKVASLYKQSLRTSYDIKTKEFVLRDVKSPIIKTDVESAALIKYASNSFLATKISFVNSLANVADKLEANVEHILEGMGLDPRIGSRYLKPGIGFGGSCLPKDIQAFYTTAEKHGAEFTLLKDVERININQPRVIIDKLKAKIGDLEGKKIVILGLAFKEDTDDIREAPSIKLIKLLEESSALIIGFDPQAHENIKKLSLSVVLTNSPEEALDQADAMVLATPWQQFKDLNWAEIKQGMKHAVIIDGRNFLDRDKLKGFGFDYEGVGLR